MIRFLGIKTFLRGGYLDVDQPSVVMRHAEPFGLWIPIVDGRAIVPLHDPRFSSFMEPGLPHRAHPAPRRRKPPADG